MKTLSTTTHIIILANVGEYLLIDNLDSVIILNEDNNKHANALSSNPLKSITMDTDEIFGSTIYPIAKEDLLKVLKSSVSKFINIFPGAGDDAYYDYTPDLFDQIDQLISNFPKPIDLPCIDQMIILQKLIDSTDNQDDPSWDEVQDLYHFSETVHHYALPKAQEELISLYNQL